MKPLALATKIVERIGLALLAVVILTFALVGVLVTTRGTPVSRVVSGPAVSDSLFARTMELFARVHLEEGNHAEILANGVQTFPRLWADLAAARETIAFQMYFGNTGAVADTLAAIFAARAKAGVRVMVLLDAFGAEPLSGRWAKRLRAAGVEVSLLRPVHWYTLDRAGNRSHARAIVIDGRIGYTGGFGIDDKWLGNGLSEREWREVNVRVEGPAVMQLLATFATGWAEATGELLSGPRYFPERGFEPRGTTQAGLLFSTTTAGSTPAERFVALTIASARERLYVANAYFVPDNDFRRLLKEAVARGVDVRILTAGRFIDIKTTQYAGRASYEDLLAGGIRIYEYAPSNMHAKTIVADGQWSAIGSMNFDNRSLALNDESSLVVLDSAFGARMEASFAEDLGRSEEILLESFRERSVISKLLERGALLFSRII